MYILFALILHLFGTCSKRPYDNGDGRTDFCVICGKDLKGGE